MSSALGEFEQLVLLAVLRLGSDAYGATIRREIETRAARELSISAVYTTLQRLEQKGLVRSRMGEPLPERGGRGRKAHAGSVMAGGPIPGLVRGREPAQNVVTIARESAPTPAAYTADKHHAALAHLSPSTP